MKRNLVGTWHNQHGSELDLEVSPDGRVSGRFRSATGLAKGSPNGSEVTGYLSGDLIVFCANFANYDSLTAWAGHVVVEAGETRIQTQWQMSVMLPARDAEELWKGIWTGSDTFRRGPAIAERMPRAVPSHPMPDWP